VGLTMNAPQPDGVADADALVHASVAAQGGFGGLEVRLTSPDGTAVELDSLGVGSWAETYDDATNPPASGTMADFNGENAYGTWTLSFERAQAVGSYTVSLSRYEMRLHMTGEAP
jgi:subtilisin-like proprotein convertase family protein